MRIVMLFVMMVVMSFGYDDVLEHGVCDDDDRWWQFGDDNDADNYYYDDDDVGDDDNDDDNVDGDREDTVVNLRLVCWWSWCHDIDIDDVRWWWCITCVLRIPTMLIVWKIAVDYFVL